jgi:hypothetical protein
MAGGAPEHRLAAALAAFHQQLEVDRAVVEPVEAVLERVLEAVEVEVPGAPAVGPVQERTVFNLCAHTTTLFPARVLNRSPFFVIGTGAKSA